MQAPQTPTPTPTFPPTTPVSPPSTENAIPYIDALIEYLLSLPGWQGFLLALTLTILATAVIGYVTILVEQRLLSRIEGNLDDKLFASLNKPTYITVFLIGLYFSTFTLPMASADRELFSSTVLTLGILLWTMALWRVGTILTRPDDTEWASESKYLDEAFLPIFNNLWKVGTVAFAGAALFSVWGIDVTPFIASAGVAGIAVGFAAKDTIANFFGGISLYFDNTYQKGDYIILDSGQAGNVIDVGIRSTVLRTREGIQVTVPNSMLNSALVVNESAPARHRRVSIPVSVAYGEDIDRVRELLLEVAEEEDLVRGQPPTRVRFLSMGASGLELDLRVWVNRPGSVIKAKDRLNTAVYKRLTEENIEIPFPQRDIHIRTDTSSSEQND